MGYTHYWTYNKAYVDIKGTEKLYQKAMSQCETVIKAYNIHIKLIDFKHPDRLSGYSAHCPTGSYKGIEVNGTQELSHETFSMRETYALNLGPKNWGFCKTARKPYDVVVVACLIVLKHYLGDLIEVNSDGYASDWYNGLELAQDVLKIKGLQIPETIEKFNRRGVS